MATSSQSISEAINGLEEDMVKKIGDKSLKEFMGALNAQLELLKQNFYLLNSLLKKDNSRQLLTDLKHCDIELQENDLAKYDSESAENALGKYDIDSLENEFQSLIKELFSCNLKLEDLSSQLKNGNYENKELLIQERDVIEAQKLNIELKICNNRLAFYNHKLNPKDSLEIINSVNESKYFFELKKCILEIKICDRLLKQCGKDLGVQLARRESGNLLEGEDSSLNEKIAEIMLDKDKVEKRKRAYQLNQCAHELHQCSLELNAFNRILLQTSRYVLDVLGENTDFKKLIEDARDLLCILLSSPQIFNRKALELLQPLVDLLYCFNKIDGSIKNYLRRFEKIKLLVAEKSEFCEQEWGNLVDNILGLANDSNAKQNYFNSVVERGLHGFMVEEIINELTRKKADKGEAVDRHRIEIIRRLADISIMNEGDFKRFLKDLREKGILDAAEILQLEGNVKKVFAHYDKEESLSKEAKSIILEYLNKKYLGALKEAYFATFFIFKLTKLEVQKDKEVSLLHADGAIDKVENCISELMKQHLQNKVTPYHSDRANPASDLADRAEEITAGIIAGMNHHKPISIPLNTAMPETYIGALQKCTDDNGNVNLEKLFFALFADYSKKGFFLVVHSGRNHRDRVDEVLIRVERMIDDKEIIDWQGVLTALEQWPDGKSLADQGSLKKRIDFFRNVIKQMESIEAAPVKQASCRL